MSNPFDLRIAERSPPQKTDRRVPWGAVPTPNTEVPQKRDYKKTPYDQKAEDEKFFARERASQIDFDFLSQDTQPKLSSDQAAAVVATKTAPKVTKESIEAKIKQTDYIMGYGNLTIAIITMFNGFMVQGVSAPASAENYDRDVGMRYAYDNAFKQLWQLEGYLLREKLSQGPL